MGDFWCTSRGWLGSLAPRVSRAFGEAAVIPFRTPHGLRQRWNEAGARVSSSINVLRLPSLLPLVLVRDCRKGTRGLGSPPRTPFPAVATFFPSHIHLILVWATAEQKQLFALLTLLPSGCRHMYRLPLLWAKRLCLINSVLKHIIRGGTNATGFICQVSSFR